MRFLSILTLVFVATTQSAAAFCTWGIFPQERQYEPLNATEAFVAYENGVQTLVLQPEWQGDVTDFAIVYPTPSRPDIVEAPEWIFDELNNATNPWLPVPMALMEDDMDFASADEAEEKSVTVVEEKQVGEYEVSVLTATDADDLAEWLEDNDYNYTAGDADKVEYYVEQGGFYFIALKVDADHFEPPIMWLEDDISDEEDESMEDEDVEAVEEDMLIEPAALTRPVDDWFWGRLSPLQITFKTDQPQLPMRTLKSDMPEMTFDLYTLADQALFVPGVDTVYANVVDAEFLSQTKSIANYNPRGKWLVRQEVVFDPGNSDADLYLATAPTATFTTVDPGSQVRFDPAALDADTGIIPGNRGQVVYTDGRNDFTFTRSLTIGSTGADVLALQQLLNDEGFTVSETGAGAPGQETTYFGGRTQQALIKYQNFYRADILEPVGLQFGTGYFGPSTIVFVNR